MYGCSYSCHVDRCTVGATPVVFALREMLPDWYKCSDELEDALFGFATWYKNGELVQSS